MTAIGVAGLGAMGSRIAGRLLADNQVFGTNRTRSKASQLIAQGMTWRDTPRQVAENAQVAALGLAAGLLATVTAAAAVAARHPARWREKPAATGS